jgi:GTP 3',8-cyclase
MKDQYERNIDYMRISVTDRCNLRCRYCMPEEGIEGVGHADILTFEEIIQIAEAGAGIGIKKIKITGGEPLVRKGIVGLVDSLKKIPGIREVTMTTNGVLLKNYAESLYQAGLDAVNISLDTLSPIKYIHITRRDLLDEVMFGIEKAYEIGLKTKINSVAMKGFNNNEIPMLAAIAMNHRIDVRFIEIMPIGLGRNYESVSVKEIQAMLEEVYGPGKESNIKHGNGPAIYLDYEGFQGSIGFISAMTNEFCKSCNRIRLTAEGELKLCLNHNYGISLRTMLRKNGLEGHILENHNSEGHIYNSEKNISENHNSENHNSKTQISRGYSLEKYNSIRHISRGYSLEKYNSIRHISTGHRLEIYNSSGHISKGYNLEKNNSKRHIFEGYNSVENNSERHNSQEHRSGNNITKEQCLKEQLQEIMKEFIYKKPFQHGFHQTDGWDTEYRNMVQIGG